MIISKKAIDQPILVLLVSALIFCLGIISYILIPIEAVPNITVPYALVYSTYSGAAPAEIEDEIIKPIEDKLVDLENLDIVNAWGFQGRAYLWVQFTPDSDTSTSIEALKDAMDEAQSQLPDDATDIVVKEVDFADIPMLILNIYGDFDTFELSRFASIIKDKIKFIDGVNDINIFGNIERVIKVIVDPEKLRINNIPIERVYQSIRMNNMNLPGGSVTIDGQELTVRTLGKLNNADDISNLTIMSNSDGSRFLVKDIGRVKDIYETPESFSRYNQQNSITLQITKKPGANIIQSTDLVEKQIINLFSSFPPSLKYQYSSKQSSDIEKQNSQLNQNAFWGIIFVIITLFFGIGFRNSLIVSFAVPFSLIVAVLIMYLTGLSQTGISMFAMIMVLGIVVDGAIIVSESTYKNLEDGYNQIEAAKKAIGTVGQPIIVAILTSIAAFSPLLYISGIMGQFLSVIPKVVIFALIGATIADHIVIPVLSSRYMQISNKSTMMTGNWFGMKIYNKLINWSMKHKLKTLIISFISFIIGLVILIISTISDYKLVKVEAFPKVPKPRFIIDVTTQSGSDLEYTNSIIQNIENVLSKYTEIESIVSTVGQSGVQNVRQNQGSSVGSEIGQLTVDLTDRNLRTKNVNQIISDFNNTIKNKWPGTSIEISTITEGPPVSNNLVIDIKGDNIDAMEQVANTINNIVKSVRGTTNTSSSIGDLRSEIQVNIDHERSALYRVSSVSIGSAVSAALLGLEATVIADGLSDIPVIIELENNNDDFIDIIKNLQIPSESGMLVPLRNVANVEIKYGPAQIFRKNFDRTISVTSDILPNYDISDIKRKIDSKLPNILIPQGISIEYGGVSDEASKAFESLGKLMTIAFIIIMIILSAQFKSLSQPFIIAVTIPLAFVGVIIGLMITRVPFGMMAFFGLVALTGIVVNDAIVLISHINDLRAEGMDFRQAIIQGGKDRLRPILLTTITTISGMLPLTFDFAGGAEYWRPLAVSLISGLIFATILTLVVIPVLYSLLVRPSSK